MSAWLNAASAFVGGGVGGLGSVWLSGRIADRAWRKENRAKHMELWRAGLKKWEDAITAWPEGDTREVPEILRSDWYGSLRRHLRETTRETIEEPRGSGIPNAADRRPSWGALIEADLDRIEREWKLK